MRRIIVVPAFFIGSLVVIWVSTVAAAHMPAQEILTPTLTAMTEHAVNNPGANSKDNSFLIGESSTCNLPSSYPPEIQQWCHFIETAALDAGLPGSLIAAVMLQESGGDPSSYSSSGAVGLMQVMPRDGIAADFMCINGPCFTSRPTIDELMEPAFNIHYGSQMLADLYNKHGSFREALFRYGPMNMGYRYADLVLTIWENYQ